MKKYEGCLIINWVRLICDFPQFLTTITCPLYFKMCILHAQLLTLALWSHRMSLKFDWHGKFMMIMHLVNTATLSIGKNDQNVCIQAFTNSLNLFFYFLGDIIIGTFAWFSFTVVMVALDIQSFRFFKYGIHVCYVQHCIFSNLMHFSELGVTFSGDTIIGTFCRSAAYLHQHSWSLLRYILNFIQFL